MQPTLEFNNFILEGRIEAFKALKDSFLQALSQGLFRFEICQKTAELFILQLMHLLLLYMLNNRLDVLKNKNHSSNHCIW